MSSLTVLSDHDAQGDLINDARVGVGGPSVAGTNRTERRSVSVDLNSDMGESYGRWVLGDDRALLNTVSSANIACGFHAGDPTVMLRTVAGAAQNGVCIGAHVAYHDLAGFGRRFVDEQPDELTADIIYQIGALQGMACAVGAKVSYVKPHGALYNRIATDERHARAVVDAIKAIDGRLGLLTLPGSVVGDIAQREGLRVYREAFADRAYLPDGHLVPRTRPGAVITDVDAVTDRVLRMVTEGRVQAIDGSTVTVHADSVCVHGDSQGAVAMAAAIKARLQSQGVSVASFIGR